MNELDKLNLERFDKEIQRYQDEIKLRKDLNTFYKSQLEHSPYLKYILNTWILNNDEVIKELHISIQYLQYERKLFLESGLQNNV